MDLFAQARLIDEFLIIGLAQIDHVADQAAEGHDRHREQDLYRRAHAGVAAGRSRGVDGCRRGRNVRTGARCREAGRGGRNGPEGCGRRRHAVGHRGRRHTVGCGHRGRRSVGDIAAHIDGEAGTQALIVDGDLLAARSGGHARGDGKAAGHGLIAAGGLELEDKAGGADGVADGVAAVGGQTLDREAHNALCLLHGYRKGAGLAHEVHGDGLVAGRGEIGGAALEAFAHVEIEAWSTL